MSLNKGFVRYRKCACQIARNLSTQSASTEKNIVKMTLGNQIRNLSGHQMKLLLQLKEYLTKSEKGFMFVLNKEWANLLQKLPLINDTVKEINTKSISSKNEKKEILNTSSTVEIPSTSSSSSNSESLFPIFRITKKSQIIKSSSGKWKNKTAISISSENLLSRTKHVLSSVKAAETEASRLKCLEDLIAHFHQYPLSVNLAIKEGGISSLLRIRSETEDEKCQEALREAFAILGYSNTLPGKGIRILSIDGGGIRGLIAIELLKKLEQLTGRPVYEMFDYICGVSTGAILLAVIGVQRKSLEETSRLYKELSTKMFTQSRIVGANRLVWSHSYYDTDKWEKYLRQYTGENELIKTARSANCPKLATVSTVVNKGQSVLAYVFRNYSLPPRVQSQYLGGYSYQIWEAVRASAAAPTYFEDFKTGDLMHLDGGILVNNPTAVAIHEARMLWPGSHLQCVVSLGTGRLQPVHLTKSGTEPPPQTSSWSTKFSKILNSATDTEAVHTILNDLLPGEVYYRFNPYLTEMLQMDEIRPDKLNQLETDAEMYYRRNEEAFIEASKALTAPRTTLQKLNDWKNLHRDILGYR